MNLKSIKADVGKQLRGLSLPASLFCCTLILGLTPVEEAKATSSAGVTAEPMAVGSLPASIRAKLKADDSGGFDDGTAVAHIVVVKFTVAPGGYFGWHRHGGPVWAVIDEGTLTLYDPDVPMCARNYEPGSAFLDAGDHVHNARNEGDAPVVVYATFMLPAGGVTRIDAPDPGVCALPPLV